MGTSWRNAQEGLGNVREKLGTGFGKLFSKEKALIGGANVAAQQWLRPGVEESPNYDWAGTDEQFNTPYMGQGLTVPQGAWDRFKGTLGRYWTPRAILKRNNPIFSDPIAEAHRIERGIREREKKRELIERELLNNPSLATERATRGYEWRRTPKDDWFYGYIFQEPEELKGKPVGTVYSGKYSDDTPIERRVPSRETELRKKAEELRWKSRLPEQRLEELQPWRYWQE
jgi:hypothetical protein